jgi:hypothetical protein
MSKKSVSGVAIEGNLGQQAQRGDEEIFDRKVGATGIRHQ